MSGVLRILLVVTASSLALLPALSLAQCPPAAPLAHYSPGVPTPCPCFVPSEEAGAVFTAPAADYPLEVLSVSFYWGSLFGGAPVSQEQALHLYNGGLPNPGAPVASIAAPMLTDGVLNTFAFGSPVPINSGPMAVTLEFLNNNSGGSPLTPSIAYDTDVCQGGGLNVVKAVPGGWIDACLVGITGDWIVEITYRPCQTPIATRTLTWGGLKLRGDEN